MRKDQQTNEHHLGTTPLMQETKAGARNSKHDSWGHGAVPNSTGWKGKVHLGPLKTYPYDSSVVSRTLAEFEFKFIILLGGF